MLHANYHQTAATRHSTLRSPGPIRYVDTSGQAVFSHGDEGAAHVAAHRLLDRGQTALGYERLGAWLDGRTGSGTDWTHLQFHMALFELGIGKWHAAYQRFLAEILPVAASTENALTDAPGLLWRLAMKAPSGIELQWQPLRLTAINSMRELREPFVELHHLLTFAGAGDRDSIDVWLRLHARQVHSRRQWLVVQIGQALRAYVDAKYAAAAGELRRLAPQVPELGGSSAQNDLIAKLARHCQHRAAAKQQTGLPERAAHSGDKRKRRRPHRSSATICGAAAPCTRQSISASTSVAMKQPPTPSSP